MPVVKLTLSEESYQELQQLAEADKLSVQDYIRSKIFGKTIFNVEEAIQRIQKGDFEKKYPDGFELPDVYVAD